MCIGIDPINAIKVINRVDLNCQVLSVDMMKEQPKRDIHPLTKSAGIVVVILS